MSTPETLHRPSRTAATTPTKKSRKRRAGGLVMFTVAAVLFSTVAVPAAQAHEPEAAKPCEDGYTQSADETECSKTTTTTEDATASCAPNSEGWCVTDHGEVEGPSCPSDYTLVTPGVGRDVCQRTETKPIKPSCPSDYTLVTPGVGRDVCQRTETTAATPTCTTGTRQGSSCVVTTTSSASYRCTSGRLTSGAYGIAVCEHFRVAQCPAGYSPLWGGCVRANPPSSTGKVCPGGYSMRGGFCYRYTLATPYCTLGTLSGHSCKRTTVVGSVAYVCGANQTKVGSNCVTTITKTPTYKCIEGTKSGSRCITKTRPTYTCPDNQPPTATNRCTITTTDTTAPTPPCDSDHTLQNGKCANPTPDGVVCPAGYEYGSGTYGGVPPHAAPTGQYWTSATATSPDIPPHSCWQLSTGGSPAGQTRSHADNGGTHNRLLVGYADLPSAPTGQRWNRESANADYACYKLKEIGNRIPFRGLAKGIRDAVMAALNFYGESHEQAAVERSRSYRATGQLLVIGICADETEIAAFFGGAASAVRIATEYKRARDLADELARVGFGGVAVDGILLAVCGRGSDTDTESAPAPASGLALSAGDGRIGVAWSASADTPEAGFSYWVQWKTGSQTWAESATAGQFEELEFDGTSVATSYAITGLTNGVAHDVRVVASKDQYLSGWIEATATPEAPKASAPGPASGLALSAGDKQIAVSWLASADTPAAGFGYRVQWKTGSQTWAESATAGQFEDLEHGDDLATSYTITGLSNLVVHSVRVAAFNDVGFSAWITGTATPAVRPPGAASGLKLAVADKRIGVSWSASADTPAAGFGYRVVWKAESQTWAESTAASQFEDLEHGDDLATSYAITGLSNGVAYTVRVAAFNRGGFSAWITGTATPTVAAKPNSPATGTPTVSGTARVGETLTAGTSGIADADGLGAFSYQWSADGSPISGATAATYTLVAADEGKAISVAVSFTDGAGNAESVASTPTAAVAPESLESMKARLAVLRVRWLELLATTVRDNEKCAGICWSHPDNAEFVKVNAAYTALRREIRDRERNGG
ncbi:MAG: fibronectin type III domain-containing protein [Cenarchaeum sp. SB0669_bin_11]|nr:fibronectin type III domain-containing protein [Cenarchaeum sp. SB0669_bin_11]